MDYFLSSIGKKMGSSSSTTSHGRPHILISAFEYEPLKNYDIRTQLTRCLYQGRVVSRRTEIEFQLTNVDFRLLQEHRHSVELWASSRTEAYWPSHSHLFLNSPDQFCSLDEKLTLRAAIRLPSSGLRLDNSFVIDLPQEANIQFGIFLVKELDA